MTGDAIPQYAMLDIWMALYGTSHPEFDEFFARHGYAETWARLTAEVRSRLPRTASDDAVGSVESAIRDDARRLCLSVVEGGTYFEALLSRMAAKAVLALSSSTLPRTVNTAEELEEVDVVRDGLGIVWAKAPNGRWFPSWSRYESASPILPATVLHEGGA